MLPQHLGVTACQVKVFDEDKHLMPAASNILYSRRLEALPLCISEDARSVSEDFHHGET